MDEISPGVWLTKTTENWSIIVEILYHEETTHTSSSESDEISMIWTAGLLSAEDDNPLDKRIIKLK